MNLDDFDFEDCYQKVGTIVEALNLESCKKNATANVVMQMVIGLDREIEKCLMKQYEYESRSVLTKTATEIRLMLLDIHEPR